mmetsp:Transcript_23153/g.57095  ORF Transcript_23153/g.57095 Transcript_23153/m.57095 type:complete len:252 (+) Transcript_23153:2897-3652(+)
MRVSTSIECVNRAVVVLSLESLEAFANACTHHWETKWKLHVITVVLRQRALDFQRRSDQRPKSIQRSPRRLSVTELMKRTRSVDQIAVAMEARTLPSADLNLHFILARWRAFAGTVVTPLLKPISIDVVFHLVRLGWKTLNTEKVIEFRTMTRADGCSCVKRTMARVTAQKKSSRNTLRRFTLLTNEENRKLLLLRTMMMSFGGHMNGYSRLDLSTTSDMKELRLLPLASTRLTGASSRIQFVLHLIKSRS